jgi:hypothetical protein
MDMSLNQTVVMLSVVMLCIIMLSVVGASRGHVKMLRKWHDHHQYAFALLPES